MFSVLRVGVAAAVVLGVGGGLVASGVLTPDRLFQQAVSPSPSESPEPTIIGVPVEFTGRIECGNQVGFGRTTNVSGSTEDGAAVVRTEGRGDAWQMVWEVSDPRLQGTYTHHSDWDSYAVDSATGGEPGITTVTVRIENDEGTWQGSRLDIGYADGQENWDPMMTLTGGGAYEGLRAVMHATALPTDGCVNDVRGYIFEHAPQPTEP
jgi:hypothetical protein